MKSSQFGWMLTGWALSGSLWMNATSSYAQPETSVSESVFEFEDASFWGDQCLLLTQADDYEAAITSCEQAISQQPDDVNADLWMARGEALLALERYPEALANYQYLSTQQTEHSLALTYQCAAHFHLNQIDEAIDFCELALKTDGDWGDQSPAIAWYYQGLAFQASERFSISHRLDLAARAYQQALAIAPEDQSIQAELCFLAAELRENICPALAEKSTNLTMADSAITDSTTIDIYPEPLGDRVGEALDIAVESYAQALSNQPHNNQPHSALLWYRQGLALEQLGRYSQASQSYSSAVALSPDNTLALAHQCSVLNELEDYETAVATCERAFEGRLNWDGIGPAYGWSQLSAAHIGMGNYADAIATAQQATILNPDYLGGWNNLAVGLWNTDKWSEADEILDKIFTLEEQPESTGIVMVRTVPLITVPEPQLLSLRREVVMAFNRGLMLHEQQRYVAAAKVYDYALETYDDSISFLSQSGRLVSDRFLAKIYTNLAIAQLQTGTDEAVASALQAVSFDKTSADTWYNLGYIYHQQWQQQPAATSTALEALKAYRAAFWQDPERSDILLAQGALFRQASCYQIAFQIFEAALNVEPDNLTAQEEYSQIAQILQEAAISQAQADAETPACSIPL